VRGAFGDRRKPLTVAARRASRVRVPGV